MRFDAYYACKAKPALECHAGLDPDLVEILAERMLFKHSEGGCTIWTAEDHSAVVKLLIIAYFKRLYPAEFLMSAPVSIEFFDQWWTLERHDGLSKRWAGSLADAKAAENTIQQVIRVDGPDHGAQLFEGTA